MKKRRHRRLNSRLIAAAAAVLTVLAVGIYGVHRYQVSRQAGGIVREAMALEKAEKPVEAAAAWRRYLSVKPDNLEVLARYADLLVRTGKTPQERLEALTKIEEVLRRDPERAALREKAVPLAVGLGRYADAIVHIDVLTADAPGDDPERRKKAAELEALRGQCQEAEKAYDKAEKSYRAALVHDPAAPDTATRLAELLVTRLDNPDEAAKVMDRLVAENPKSARAYLRRSEYRNKHRIKGVEDDLAKARELDPKDVDVILAVASTAKKPETARAELRRGIGIAPADVRFYIALTDLELRENRTPEAVAVLRDGLKAAPDHKELRFTLADLLLQRKETLDEAHDLAAALRKEGGLRPALLDLLDAKEFVMRGKWVEAAHKLEEAKPGLQGESMLRFRRQALFLLGECDTRTGNQVGRKEAFGEVAAGLTRDDPMWATVHLELASALVALQQTEEALAEYRLVLPRAPAVSAVIARLLLARTLAAPAPARNWAPLEAALDDAARLAPDASDVPMVRAEMLAARGRRGDARATLEAARDRWPDRPEPLLGLGLLESLDRKPEKAEAAVAAAEAKFGDRVEFRLARARLLTDRDGAAAVPRITELARDVAAFDDAQKKALLTGLVAAHLRVGAVAEARALWDRALAADPDNLSTWTTAFDLAGAAGDEPAMARALAGLERIEGADGTLVHLGKAFTIVRQKAKGKPADLAEARRHLDRVVNRQGASPSARVVLAKAEIESLSGNTAEAAAGYLKAVELGDVNPLVLRKAVVLLHQEGRNADAYQLFHKLEDAGALTDDLKRLGSDLALRLNDEARALELARQPVAAGSKNVADHVWLGQVLWAEAQAAAARGKSAQAKGLNEEAGRTLRGAVALGGDAAAAVALVRFLAGTGQADKAEAAFRAYAQRPESREQQLALAECQEALRHEAEARAHYQAALAATPDAPAVLRAAAAFEIKQRRVNEAEPLLIRLMSLKAAPAADVSWARHTLGMALAAVGQYRESTRALKVLGLASAADDEKGTVEDRRTNARVLALQTSPEHRKRAIRVLERLAGESAVTDADRFLLAQLYDNAGEWVRAREILLLLLASDRKDPSTTAYFAERLFARGEPDEAAALVAMVERMEPGSFRTAALKARAAQARGAKDSEVAALINSFLGSPGGEQATAAAAVLYEQLKLPAPAEALYRKLAAAAKPGDASGTLALAGFLARQGRLKEGLDVCESAREKVGPQVASAVALDLIFSTRADDAQAARVEGWLKADIAKAPEQLSLQFNLANLYTRLRRYDAAEATYRTLIEKSPDKSLALNNLAYVLAVNLDRNSEALDLINRAIALEGNRPELLDTRAVIYLRDRKPELARKDLEDSIVNLTKPETCLHLAQALWDLKDRTGSARALDRARAAGLREETLDPAEQAAFGKLVGELARQ